MVELKKAAPAEQAVLGSMLIDERTIGPILGELTGAEFLLDANRIIFQTIRKMFSAGAKVDPVTVLDELKQAGAGDLYDYVRELLISTPTAANWEVYVPIVRSQSREYRLENLAGALREADGLEAKAEILAKMNELTAERQARKIVTMKQAMTGFFERHRAKREYLRWGFPELDERLYVAEGSFVILGGYPSDGKTALALSFAYEQAEHHRVGFFSLETDDGTLADRLVSRVALLDMGKIKRSELTEEDYDAVTAVSTRFVDRSLEIVSAAGMTVDDIFAVAQSRRHEIIYVDYIQLIRGDRTYGRVNEVTGISLDLHSKAQSTGITVVGLSQLSRPDKTQKRQAPTMRDLRESGQLEQDADVIMLVYRTKPQDMNDIHRALDIAKNKEGTTGTLFLSFHGPTQSFLKDYVTTQVKQAEAERAEMMEQLNLEDLPKKTPIPDEFKKRTKSKK